MRSGLLSGVAAIGLTAVMGMPAAHATLALELIQPPNADITVVDNGPLDQNSALGTVTFNGAAGTYNVDVTAVGSLTPPGIDLNSVNATTTTGGLLRIIVSQTGFSASGPTAFNGEIDGTLLGSPSPTVTFNAYYDLSNSLFGEQIPLASFSFAASPFAVSDISQIGPTSSFSLTEQVDITSTVATSDISQIGTAGSFSSTVNFNAQVTDPAPIPEPASLVLLGTALAGLGLLSRRRRRQSAPPG